VRLHTDDQGHASEKGGGSKVKLALEELPHPASTYLRVKCPDCGNVAMIYSHSKTVVKCKVCGAVLAKPTGGKARILGQVLEAQEGRGGIPTLCPRSSVGPEP